MLISKFDVCSWSHLVQMSKMHVSRSNIVWPMLWSQLPGPILKCWKNELILICTVCVNFTYVVKQCQWLTDEPMSLFVVEHWIINWFLQHKLLDCVDCVFQRHIDGQKLLVCLYLAMFSALCYKASFCHLLLFLISLLPFIHFSIHLSVNSNLMTSFQNLKEGDVKYFLEIHDERSREYVY